LRDAATLCGTPIVRA